MNRIADVVFEPLAWAALALICSYALRRRAPRLAAALPALAGVVLVFFAIPAVGNGLMRALERPVLSTAQPGVVYDAVIVLGGAMSLEVTADTGQPAYGDGVERMLTAFELLRSGRAKNAILSGGPGAGQESEAHLMARQLVAWGIDESRLALEEQSENTHENAVGSVAIARAHGWTHDVLVTSAGHMKRAYGCFVNEGLPVDTLAVDFQSSDPSRHRQALLPRAHALAQSTAAIREAAGRIVYRWRGWTR